MKTYCINGHKIEDPVILRRPKKTGEGFYIVRRCRICFNQVQRVARNRQYHQNIEKLRLYNREYQKAYRVKNPEKVRARERISYKRYYNNHRDDILRRKKEQYWMKKEGVIRDDY